MRPFIWIVSVPHSGYHSLTAILDAWGLVAGFREAKLRLHTHIGYRPHETKWVALAEEWIVTEGHPTIIPLRDPAYVDASRLNRRESACSETLKIVALWQGLPNVHFFRVDCPVDEQQRRYNALATFCQVAAPGPLFWPVINISDDRLGLKAALDRGESPPELTSAIALRTDLGVRALLEG